MFHIDAEPTFKAALTIVGQGRMQKLNVTFRHKTRSEYAELLKSVKDDDDSGPAAVMQLVTAWDADADLSVETLKRLEDQQPGALAAILAGYIDALLVARKGN